MTHPAKMKIRRTLQHTVDRKKREFAIVSTINSIAQVKKPFRERATRIQSQGTTYNRETKIILRIVLER